MIDFEALMNEPNGEDYHAHVIDSAYNGEWIEATTRNGLTPLHIAANMNLHKNIESLLRTGGNINCVNYMGETPLHCAIQWDRLEVAYKIITNPVQQIDLTIVDKNGHVAFDYCEYHSKCYTLYESLVKAGKMQTIAKIEKVKMELDNIIQTIIDEIFRAFLKDTSRQKLTKKEVYDIMKAKYPKVESNSYDSWWKILKEQKREEITVHTIYIKQSPQEYITINKETVAVDLLFS